MISIPYDRQYLNITLPEETIVLTSRDTRPINNLSYELIKQLNYPISSPSLKNIILKKRAKNVCIVVSDITRPVPHDIILPSILKELSQSGIEKEHIIILIATGMHKPTTHSEKISMFGKKIVSQYRIVDHDANDKRTLLVTNITTPFGTNVRINRFYMESDIRITIGFIEPRFMAGFSGGRKTICPGIVGADIIKEFHSPDLLENSNAACGILENNPCHEMALNIATKIGVDFSINITLDKEKNITGIFCGDIVKAHLSGIEEVKRISNLKLGHAVDIVITSGGGYPLDATFYQSIKGIVSVLPLVAESGTIVIAAGCKEGIGSKEFKELLFKYNGNYEGFIRDIINSTEVKRDQWQYEMLCRVLKKVGIEGVIFCTANIDARILKHLSVTPSYNFSDSLKPETILEDSLNNVLQKYNSPKIAIVPEGPYIYI